MRISRGLLACLLATAVVGMLGCGGGGSTEPTFDLVPASAAVTLDGKPLSDADVSFVLQGAAPKGFASSGGRTDANGKLEVKTGNKSGTVVGSYKVLVSKLTRADGSPLKNIDEGVDIEQLRAAGDVKEAVPQKYTTVDETDITAEVTKDGKNEFDFKLSGS